MGPLTRVLLCGGAGFIGGHTAIQLANTGRYYVIIVDNFANSSQKAVDAILALCPAGSAEFHKIDIYTEPERLKEVGKFDAIVHFAALKSVPESVERPLLYYKNNLMGMVNVIEAADRVGCRAFLFSSSATVYKPSETLLTEEAATGPCNPYGQTKFFGEQILKDVWVSDKTWKMINLRYFNPIGAHPSGTFGENAALATNIMPAINRALFQNKPLNVMGTDWPTRDGTGERDYIHVMDIADGHVAAIDAILAYPEGKVECYNLGTGKGTTVLELVQAFEKASGRTIERINAPRRAGDLASCVADPGKMAKEIGFTCNRDIKDACADAWRWMEKHPHGFNDAP